jgi:hypothetical protein
MRRAIRVMALSLLTLLTGGLAFVWARSHFVAEAYHVYDEAAGREYNAMSSRGVLSLYREAWDSGLQVLPTVLDHSDHGDSNFWREPLPPSPPRLFPPARRDFSQSAPFRLDARAAILWSDPRMEGFGPHLGLAFFRAERPSSGGVFHEVMIPYWLVTLGAAAPALWLLRRHRRARRAVTRGATGLCVTCGYDLRGAPGRCPECGTAPSPRLDPPVAPA